METDDSKRSLTGRGGGDINPAADRFAVEDCVFSGHYGRGDQQGYSSIVDTGESFHQSLLRYTTHCVPHAGTNKALASREKESRGKEYVCLGRMGKVHGGRIEVESNGEDDDQSDGMGPNVDRLVGEIESRFNAINLVLGKPIASGDIWVDSPGMWKIFVRDKALVACHCDGIVDALLQGLLCTACFLQAFIYNPFRFPSGLPISFLGDRPATVQNLRKTRVANSESTSL